MQPSFGHSLKLSLAPASPWLSLGPGWAALAGALAAGPLAWDMAGWGRLVGLWLLADLLLGTLWELAVRQGLWLRAGSAGLPPSRHGFVLPYTQVASPAGRLTLAWRRYRARARQAYGRGEADPALAFGLAALLALLLSLWLAPALAGLTLLAIGLSLAAGGEAADLAGPAGGRLPALVQFLLPWLMGLLAGSGLSPAGLALGLCFWSVYLGGLRWLGGHQRADLLFFFGQVAALGLLLALRLLPAAAAIGVLLAAQGLVRTRYPAPTDLLPRLQPYLVVGLLAAAVAVGRGEF